jgi:hypothetical protein
MPERRLLSVGVECYAGHRGEETPRTLILGDRRIPVADVVDAWLAPDYRCFKLKDAEGNTYLLRHDDGSNTWELTSSERKALVDDEHDASAGAAAAANRSVGGRLADEVLAAPRIA